ncbi:MAG: hypothetical protein JOZ43_08175 [Acidobacteriales bacterium]|nr:hypothetical protein [Terriglobales bacterium]
MDQNTIIIVAVIVIALIVAGWLISRRRKSEQLRQHFGPEYERELKRTGDASQAERALEERARRVKNFEIRSLPTAERQRYSEEWLQVQRRFVDDPRGAVSEAHTLVQRVMQSRGYPMGDFDRQAEDLSVHYPDVISHYRSAHEIALRHGKGQASTEDMRQAMVHYRSLFDELLESKNADRKEVA